MGMYDELTCEYPLLDKHKKYQNETFQTKSLINCLDKYVITRDGELFHQSYNWDIVPEEERPYYKDPTWDKFSWIGCLKTTPNEPVKLNHTGEVRFYFWDTDIDLFIEYIAFFSKGKLMHFELNTEEK